MICAKMWRNITPEDKVSEFYCSRCREVTAHTLMRGGSIYRPHYRCEVCRKINRAQTVDDVLRPKLSPAEVARRHADVQAAYYRRHFAKK